SLVSSGVRIRIETKRSARVTEEVCFCVRDWGGGPHSPAGEGPSTRLIRDFGCGRASAGRDLKRARSSRSSGLNQDVQEGFSPSRAFPLSHSRGSVTRGWYRCIGNGELWFSEAFIERMTAS